MDEGRLARLGPALPWLGLLTMSFISVASAARLVLWRVALTPFVARNELGAEHRAGLVLCALVPVLIAGLAVVMLFALRTPKVWKERLEWAARLTAPLALALPALFLSVGAHWVDHALEFLLLLLVATLAAERLFRLAFPLVPAVLAPLEPTLATLRANRFARALPLVLVIAAAIAYAVFLGVFSIQQHHRFLTGGYDLGHYEILMYNALHGSFFRSPILWGIDGGNNLANHAELAMLLFVPFYAIHPGPEAMLVIQAVMMGGSVIPLYLLCRSALSALTSLSLCFAYLIAASFSSPLFYDFHWLPLAIPFQFLLMYALNTRRWKLAAVALLLALLVREDVALTLAVASTYFVTSKRNVKLGVALCAVCLTWFVGMKFGVMRVAGNFDFGWIYQDLIIEGEKGVGSVVKTGLTNPLYVLGTLFTKPKLVFMLHLLVPLAFLPWRNWRWALFSAGGAVVTLLTTNTNDAFLSIRFHYLAHWTPFLFAGVVVALATLGRSGPDGVVLRRSALGALLFASVLHSLVFGAIFDRSRFVGGFNRIPFEMSQAEVEKAAVFERAKASIPPDATVAATDYEVAQLCTRMTAYSGKVTFGTADYVLLDRTHLDKLQIEKLSKLFTTEPYGVVFDQHPYLVFKRGARTPATEQAARSIGVSWVNVP